MRYLPGITSLGGGPGDEVITTPFTFTAEVISAVGATPVLLILTLKRLISTEKW